MFVSPLGALILVQTSLRLDVVQDILDLTHTLKVNMAHNNNTNKALWDSIDVVEAGVEDIYSNVCITVEPRIRRQAFVALGTGLVSALITLVATSGEFLNFLNPHGDQIDVIQHQIASPDLQLRLECDDRLHIQKLTDRIYLVEEIDRIKTLARHTRDLTDQFLKPNPQTPIARKVRERSAILYRKKFKKLPRAGLDFSILMTSNTHFVSGDATNRCITGNLTMT